MTIAATRFKMLDKQTNVGIGDFIDVNSSSIFNSPNLDFSGVTEAYKALLETDVQVPKVVVPTGKDLLLRAGKDALGAIKDIKKLSTKDINKAISEFLPNNPAAQAAFTKLSTNCQTKGLGGAGLGKPYSLDINCGGKKQKSRKQGCNAADYSNVLNKLTNGGYAKTYSDLNESLKNLVSLSKFGYDMNMCGVFTSLSSGLENDVLSRASGALLGLLGTSGNALGVMDLANASSGLHTLLENPGGIKQVFKGFKLPTEIIQSGYTDFSNRLTGSMELLNDKWNTSSFDNSLSIAEMPGYNTDLGNVFKSSTMNNSFSVDNLDTPIVSDISFMCTAYDMNSVADPNKFLDGLF